MENDYHGLMQGKRILITGGTGSLGTALVARLVYGQVGEPASIKIFSRDELKQAQMRVQFPDSRLKFIIGDVRDEGKVELALQNVDIIFNTAALKRVETCQRFPSEAIKTNCLGTINIIETIQRYVLPVETVVGVSSDKGCQPINTYGATKFLQERVLLAANEDCPDTRFVSVCYGNVLASRGSVIPIFAGQIKAGGPVTIHDPDMTRFLISLDTAVDTLLEAVKSAYAGEIYIPVIPAATVGDIASVMINGRDIDIAIVGKGEGEKVHEVLISREDAEKTTLRNGYYVVTPYRQDNPAIEREYSSSDYLINKTELRELFRSVGLLGEIEKGNRTNKY